MKKILLVDDNESFKVLIKTLFETNHCQNYQFIEADNPIDALDKFYKYGINIEIVLCDFFLPVQNGNELLEIIKQQSPTTKCLLISGDDHIKNKKFKFVDETFSKLSLNELISYVKKLDPHFS